MRDFKLDSEAELIQKFLVGNTEVLEGIYQHYFPAVRKYVINNSGSVTEAEDIFQDAMVLTYQKLKTESIELQCSLKTYVFSVAKYLWLNNLKRRKKITFFNLLPELSENLNSEILETIQKNEKLVFFQQYFLKLNRRCQELLELFFNEKSMKHIAESMGLSPKYVRKKKFECKKQLLKMMESDPRYKEL